MKGNRLQIRLDGPFFAASLGNSSTIALRNRQKLSSPSQIFASILQVRQAPSVVVGRFQPWRALLQGSASLARAAEQTDECNALIACCGRAL